MSDRIHPAAIVDPCAHLADDVEVGPYAIIEAGATIGSGCTIGAHAQVLGSVILGKNNTLKQGAILGGDPQDLKFDPDTPSLLKIGDENTFREHVTLHRGASENSVTLVGDRNFFMAGSHVGHDSVVGNDNVFANNALVAGHVHLGDRAFFGGGSALHQHIRVGDLCMVKGTVGVSADIPPFTIVQEMNQIRGLNSIGLRRAGYSPETRRQLKAAYKHLLRSNLNLAQALESIDNLDLDEQTVKFVDFFRASSSKGICRC